MTYADDPYSHAKTEFAFDVFQAAKGHYASAAYKSFIGFEVAKPLLERAFLDTYGIGLEKVFLDVDLTIGSYRRAVGSVLPALTRVAWQIKKQEIRKDAPSATRKTFLYNLSRSSYEKNWGATYKRPGIGSKFLAFAFRVMPRTGPLRPLSFKRLTPEIERMYMESFNSTIAQYRELLSEQDAGRLRLPNDNLDVGAFTAEGKYTLADSAYSRLLHKLQGHYTEISQDLRDDILAFYREPGSADSNRTNAGDSARVVRELDQLRAVNLDLTRKVAHDMTTGSPRSLEVSAAAGSPASR